MMYVHLAITAISFVAVFVIGLAELLDGKRRKHIGFWIVLFVFLVSLATLIIFDTMCEGSEWEDNEAPYAVEPIIMLSDNNMIKGKYYLRSGYIEEDLYYQYLVKLDNGGFKANKVKSENTTLFYDTGNYRVEWHKRTKKWLYWKQEETYNKIYIPEGSIFEDYYIDLN